MILEIQNTLRQHGERDIMLNKGKLAREILGLSGAAAVISIFVFGFLSMTADSLVLSYCEKYELIFEETTQWAIGSWIQSISFIAAVVVFVVLFLFLVGQKIEQAATELQRKEALLREEREVLIRGLSHDIRTPLTAILSYSEYMQEKENIESGEMKDYIGLMQQKAEQIKELTNRLLDGGSRTLERFENGKLLIEQLADEWEASLEDEFKCRVNLDDCPNFSGEFDIQELRRIFDNLASNIKKYADPEKPVYLKLFEKENHLLIEQRNVRKENIAGVESNKIGIESIRKIAENYGGDVSVMIAEQDFSITIKLTKIR